MPTSPSFQRAALRRTRVRSLGTLANPTARTPNTANAISDVIVHTMNSTPTKARLPALSVWLERGASTAISRTQKKQCARQ